MLYPSMIGTPERKSHFILLLPAFLILACAQPGNSGATEGKGGASGGAGGKGGAGGTNSVGGSAGSSGSGGTSSAGGSKGSGGVNGSGGVASTGGGSGGTSSTGGTVGRGGTTGSGGTAGTSGSGGASGGAGGKGGAGGGAGASGGASGSGAAGGGSGGNTNAGGNGGDKTGGAGAGGSSGGGTTAAGGNTGTGGTAGAAGGAGGGMGGTAGAGGTAAGGSSATGYYGYLPVPSSTNAAKADAKTAWTTWKGKYYQECSNGSARIMKDGGNETVSEGIGYGMLMSVGNDDQSVFDKLWAYYKAHEDKNSLMNWKINACDSGYTGQYAATDGDEDAAMALIQADAKWGGYKTDATTLINAIKKYETAAGPPSNLLPGDAPGGWAAGTVNPSYFAPGYWHVWATYMNDPFWNTLATDAYTALAAYQKLSISGSTGALVPNWGMISGTATDANYGYDACRTPWRVTVDYVWFQTAAAKTFLQNVSTYVDSKNGVANVPFDKNTAFVGAFALSGMAVSQAKADQYLNDWMSATLDDAAYFQGALRGLYLLVANQKFPKGN